MTTLSFLFTVFIFIENVFGGHEYRPLEPRMLRIRTQFDENLPRLGNVGEPTDVPDGHAGQIPQFGKQSIHYIELVPTKWTQLSEGAVIYKGEQTTKGGDSAIDHTKAIIAEENEMWLNIPLTDIEAGTYKYIRTSVAYQEYSVKWNLNHLGIDYPGYLVVDNITQTDAYFTSFLGVNTWIESVTNNGLTLNVSSNKLQGFWTFVTDFGIELIEDQIHSGDGTPGGTTVPNPLFATSDIPQGSCIVVGEFPGDGLIIPDAPENNWDNLTDILLTLRYSINSSFEWIDSNGNGEWDQYADETPNENVVDMGTRGLWPVVDDLDREIGWWTTGFPTNEPSDVPTSNPTTKKTEGETTTKEPGLSKASDIFRLMISLAVTVTMLYCVM